MVGVVDQVAEATEVMEGEPAELEVPGAAEVPEAEPVQAGPEVPEVVQVEPEAPEALGLVDTAEVLEVPEALEDPGGRPPDTVCPQAGAR